METFLFSKQLLQLTAAPWGFAFPAASDTAVEEFWAC